MHGTARRERRVTVGRSRIASRLVDWALRSEGSSRSSALIRIGLAILLWTRWADDVAPWHGRFEGTFEWSILAVSFYLSTSLMLVGLFSRLAAAWAGVTALAFYHFGPALVGPGPWVHHHTYLLACATLLCALTPCDRSYSLDRWLAIRRAERRDQPLPPERGNLWGLRLIALQLSAVYLWSAFDKMNPAFLSGARLDQILRAGYLGSDPIASEGWPIALAAAAWATVALEIALGVGLHFRRTRRWVVLPGIAMHALFYLLFPVATYSATMWLLYLAYFDADRVHAVIDRVSDPGAPRSAGPGPAVQPS